MFPIQTTPIGMGKKAVTRVWKNLNCMKTFNFIRAMRNFYWNFAMTLVIKAGLTTFNGIPK